MPLDGLTLSALADELNNALVNARIGKIYQLPAAQLHIHVRTMDGNGVLVISAHPHLAGVYFTPTVSTPYPVTPPAFCMLLRKHLEPGRLLLVEQPGLERVLHLYVEGQDDAGRRCRRVLIVELTGRYCNVILVDDASHRILDALRRQGPEENRYRTVQPGDLYVPPPPLSQLDPRDTNRETFYDLLRLAAPNEELARLISANVSGFGPFAARELLARAELPPKARRANADLQDLARLADAYAEFAHALQSKAFSPQVIYDADDTPTDYWLWPTVQVAAHRQGPAPTVGSALADVLRSQQARQHVQTLRNRLSSAIRDHLQRCERKAALQREAVVTSEEGDHWKRLGELLTANLYRVRKGDTEVIVQDYYDPEGRACTIPLDPQLDPAANAQRFFARYQKAKKTQLAAGAELAQTEAEVAYLEAMAVATAQAEGLGELQALADELDAEGYLPDNWDKDSVRTGKASRPPQREHRSAEPLGPRIYRSPDGFQIWVGRNNRQNDELTLRRAHPNDVWLHTQRIPGSHVIIHSRGQAVPPTTLQTAAVLAAHFSQARDSSQVPVDYTECRHVRKPRGAKPGMVIYDHQRTIYVTPTAEHIQAIPPWTP